VPVFIPLYFEPTRKRLTYPRLGCPDYKPTREVRFALIVMTGFALLGMVVFLVTALASVHVLRPFFEHAPVWAVLGGSGLLVLLTWWYRSRRFPLYVVAAAVAVVAGYLFTSHMLVKLAVITGAVGVVMTITGVLLLRRFLRCSPQV
jgi:MFS superfamily sulfate permease-like transporter